MSAPLTIHPNFKKLSHSAVTLLEDCPRKYQLDRLSTRVDMRGEDVHMDFGHLVGNLVQNYLAYGNTNAAVWNAFLSYPRALMQEELSPEKDEEKRNKKDFFFAMHALDKFIELHNMELPHYTVPNFDGKPAIELGFIIKCPGNFEYRGKLDALLVNERTGAYACFECKTTGNKYLHPAMYRHSGQGIGYSAIVDAVASKLGLQRRNSFPILYPVYQSSKMEWTIFDFVKTRSTHADWIRHLLRSIQHVSEYAEDELFPMHGQNCFKFNRPCHFFTLCEMQTKHIVGPIEKVVIKKDKEEEYPFVFSLDELIEAQIEKLGV